MGDLVLFEKDGPIARLTLNRPEKRNPLSDALLDQLLEHLAEIDNDPELKLSILAGDGPSFCAGFDYAGGTEYTRLEPLNRDALLVEENKIRALRLRMQDIWNVRKPIIAKIHGYCVAGGCYLQMLCDLVVAADDAVIGHPGTATGPVTISPMWVWHLGVRKAFEMLSLGKLVSGTEAAHIGLVNLSFPAATLDDEVDRIAQELARTPLDGLIYTKEALHADADIMGLSAMFRTHAHIQTLGRFGHHKAEHLLDDTGDGRYLSEDWRLSHQNRTRDKASRIAPA